MKIWVNVRAGSRKEEIVKEGEEYKIYVLEVPERGRANDAVLKALAKHLEISLFRLRLVSGSTTKRKLIAIDE